MRGAGPPDHLRHVAAEREESPAGWKVSRGGVLGVSGGEGVSGGREGCWGYKGGRPLSL